MARLPRPARSSAVAAVAGVVARMTSSPAVAMAEPEKDMALVAQLGALAVWNSHRTASAATVEMADQESSW